MGSARGFSLVELITVILLMGIVGVTVFVRLQSSSAFDEVAVRDAVVATARAAQQMALGREDVTFRIEPSGGDWLLSARSGADIIRSAEVPGDVVALTTGPTAASPDSCATNFEIAVASDFSVQYDSLGNALSFTNNDNTEDVENGIRICVNENDSMSVCISPGGYAAVGNCDD